MQSNIAWATVNTHTAGSSAKLTQSPSIMPSVVPFERSARLYKTILTQQGKQTPIKQPTEISISS